MIQIPAIDPAGGLSWKNFFIELSDALGIEPPNFSTPARGQNYDAMFQVWCMRVQAAINDVTPLTIDDPPLTEAMNGHVFGRSFLDWFNAVATEV